MCNKFRDIIMRLPLWKCKKREEDICLHVLEGTSRVTNPNLGALEVFSSLAYLHFS